MMKKYLTTLFAASAIALLAAPVSKVWTFQNGFNSDDGTIQMTKLGSTELLSPGLRVTGGTTAVPTGLRSAKVYPALSPLGDWTISIRFKLDAEKLKLDPEKKLMVLFDNKAVFWPPAGNSEAFSHSGIGIVLTRRGENFWVPTVYLGYGQTSGMAMGTTCNLADGKTHTLITRFSVKGELEFILDGKRNTLAKVPSGAIFPAKHYTAIGDRAGAAFWGLEGVIEEVKLDFEEPKPLETAWTGRFAFERTESAPATEFTICNNRPDPAENVKFRAEFAGKALKLDPVSLPPWGKSSVRVALPALLRPGKYLLKITAEDGKGISAVAEREIAVVAEMNPDAMGVLMWQDGNAEKIAEIGFTHQLAVLAPKYQGKARGDLKEVNDWLDTNLRAGLRTSDLIKVMLNPEYTGKYNRVDRSGKPGKRPNVDASNPELLVQLAADAERAGAAYGGHPGLDMVLVNSEIRDGSFPAFNGSEEAAYQKKFGRPIPAAVTGRQAPPLRAMKEVSLLDVIPDTMELYQYYCWWWKDGDGWNNLHRICYQNYCKGLGKAAEHMTGFYDPVVRTPPIFGSGAGMPMVNQWSYCYPSPLKLATAVDEMRTMARGNGGQKLMKCTQAIWYRSPPAPKDKKVDNPPAWVAENPDAAYISIAPDHLREAFWSKISRRLDMIAYHGYGSLVENDTRPWNTYRYTNKESKNVLAGLIRDVVRPLGPVLKKVPEREPETAVLYTLGSNLFGQTGSWGWGWGADAEMHQIFQRAQYDPAVLFDEDMAAGRLKGIKVLAMPNCAVMTESAIKTVREFQKNGGIVVGDRYLNALILPDVTLDMKAGDEANAKILREKLSSLVGHYADCDSVEAATHVRSWKSCDYLFAVNDRRTFGDYVGMYGNVKEKGLPQDCTLSLPAKNVKVIYDLVKHAEVPFTVKADRAEIPWHFEPCDGCMLLAMPVKIGSVRFSVPETSTLAKAFAIDVEVLDEAGNPVEAILPLEIRIQSANKSEMVGSGYYEITDGRRRVMIQPSSNDVTGAWTVSVRELASGKSAERSIALTE